MTVLNTMNLEKTKIWRYEMAIPATFTSSKFVKSSISNLNKSNSFYVFIWLPEASKHFLWKKEEQFWAYVITILIPTGNLGLWRIHMAQLITPVIFWRNCLQIMIQFFLEIEENNWDLNSTYITNYHWIVFKNVIKVIVSYQKYVAVNRLFCIFYQRHIASK